VSGVRYEVKPCVTLVPMLVPVRATCAHVSNRASKLLGFVWPFGELGFEIGGNNGLVNALWGRRRGESRSIVIGRSGSCSPR
jgi:hypothetical protein